MTLPLVGRRLLGVFPHPDDEAYAAGGLLASSAKAGATVHVASATQGEAGYSRLPPRAGVSLGQLRAEELAASCSALGVEPPIFLGLPDSGLEDALGDSATSSLTTLLHRLRPEVVVSLGREGVYGHGDHVACTRWVEDAVSEAVRDGLPQPRLLLAAFPTGLFESFRSCLRRVPGLIHPDWYDGELGIQRGCADWVLDIRDASESKRAALSAHVSQLRNGDPDSLLGPGVVPSLMEEEWFVQVAGPALPSEASSCFDGL